VLRFSRIGAECAKELSKGIKENSSLRCLNLQKSQIGDDGAAAIC